MWHRAAAWRPVPARRDVDDGARKLKYDGSTLPDMPQNPDANSEAQLAWSANAEFWDKRMAEGNEFFNLLVWPAVERLLHPQPGERLLDIACWNGAPPGGWPTPRRG